MTQKSNRDNFGKSALGKNPCQYIVTVKKVLKGEPHLNVRCHCMAPFGSKPYGHSLKYSPIGVARTLVEAKAMWDTHVAMESLTRGDALGTLLP